MANSVSVELRGVDSLRSKLLALVPRVRNGIADAVALSALLIETDAKLMAPVDTGRLRSSIHADIAPDRLSAVVTTNVSYAPFIEFGTKRMKAKPFLFPAYEKNRSAFLANLKAATKLF